MKRFVFTVALGLVLTGAVFAQSELQPIANVRLLKSEPITLKQLKSRVDAYQKELGRVMTLDERKKVLDTLINERLVVQAAEKEGVRLTDTEVNQNFLQMISSQVGRQVTELEFTQIIRQQTGLSLDDFMKAQNGMTLVEYKAFLKNQLVAQRYVFAKKQSDLQNMAGPSDADIRYYYEMYKQNFVQPDTVQLFLVVSPKTAGGNVEEARKRVEDLNKQLREKPDSVREIKTRSLAPNSGFQAGDMYVNKTATASQQLGITMDALMKIFSMEIGSVSDVTETTNDFQCFIVRDKFSAKVLGISDVVQPGTTVTVYEYIKNNLMAQAQEKAVSEAMTQVINELRTPDNFQLMRTGSELDKLLSW